MSAWRFAGCPSIRVEGRWWRMLAPRWQHEPLSGAGAARNGGRWNPRGMPALYLSATHATAIAEYMQALIHPGTLTPYDIDAEVILDLTDPAVRAHLGVEDALMTLPWRRIRDVERRDPASWDFARAAVAARFDGLKTPSVLGGGVNLVLWRWGVPALRVVVVDPNRELPRS